MGRSETTWEGIITMTTLLKQFDRLLDMWTNGPLPSKDDIQGFRDELIEAEMVAEALTEEVDKLEDQISDMVDDDDPKWND